MKNIVLSSLILLALLTSLSSCEKDDPEIPNEEELITTVRYVLTPIGGGNPVTLSFVDLDGEGGNAPVIQGGSLDSNSVYSGELFLLNEAENPAEDITQEIKDEGLDHQFFFQQSMAGLIIGYADQDANGKPIGLLTTINTSNPSSGSLTIILRHKPEKEASGVWTGDITNAGGETDIQVTFPIDVQ